MSFKRDGDDASLLNELKHKRVNDLLGEHVPEDEAKLLSNGRLTCLICSHRPIFDTMKILVVHRKGHKHTQELHKYLAHKQRLELKESKKIQFDSIRKEQEMKRQILGSRLLTSAASRPTKRKAIDITSKNPFGVTQGPSASSQVRKYLKEISKKTPLSRVVTEMKESYPDSKMPRLNEAPTSEVNPSSQDEQAESKFSSSKHLPTSDQSLLSTHLSGWIRDKFGNLIKDPDAEFDSSDDEA